jgi:hypothetical protein
MEDTRNAILVARKEYQTILVYILFPAIYQGLKSIWEDAKLVKKSRPREVFAEFQNRLSRVRKWNQDVIDNEYNRIIDKTKCDYLEELIKRVFVINTQILAAVNMHHTDPSKKIKVKVPKGDKFIHCVYKECARAFFENALLMEDRDGSISRVEQMKNLQRAYKLIMTCIENTIRNLLPIENLLRDSLGDEEGEDVTPPAVLFNNPGAFGQHFWGPPNGGGATSAAVQHPSSTAIAPSELENKPLTSFPTLSSFLQNNGGTGVTNSNANPPSNGSLQPSMNELGSVPLPAEPQMYQRFADHKSQMATALTPSNEPGQTDQQRPEGEDRKIDDYPAKSAVDTDRDRSPFNPDSLFESTDGGRDNEKRDDGVTSSRMGEGHPLSDKPETKTIYLGNLSRRRSSVASTSNRRNRDTDYNSQNSDDSDGDNARNKRDIGGEDFDQRREEEIPVSRPIPPREKIDLDVYSSDNELPVKPSRFDDKTPDMESHRNVVPPLENGDTANFFSDAE